MSIVAAFLLSVSLAHAEAGLKAPAANAAKAGMDATKIALAGIRASMKVVKGLEIQRHRGEKLNANEEDIKTALKLRMRINNGELKTAIGAYRRYPEDKDFDRSSKRVAREIEKYLSRLPKDEPFTTEDPSKEVGEILTRSVKRMAGAMSIDFKSRSVPQPPPPDKGELEFLK